MEKDIELSKFLFTDELEKRPDTRLSSQEQSIDAQTLSTPPKNDSENRLSQEMAQWLNEFAEAENSFSDFFMQTDDLMHQSNSDGDLGFPKSPIQSSAEPHKKSLTKEPLDSSFRGMSEGSRGREKRLSQQLGQPAGFLYYVAPLKTVVQDVVTELSKSQRNLLSLNRSRRQALYEHLIRLGGLNAPPSASYQDPLEGWLYSPKTPEQEKALLAFFEEVAIIYLGQTLLLKAWSDRGIRYWKTDDLSQVNWAVTQAIRPKVKIHQEGWQLTRPNLYSWYTPPTHILQKVHSMIREWNLKDEGPTLLPSIIPQIRNHTVHSVENQGYDERFFRSLWQNMSLFGLNPCASPNSVLNSKAIGFCPTLRDGSVIRTGPSEMDWVGLESYSFQLLLSELTLLWKGPTAAPLWSLGNGLEVHQKEQLQMNWTNKAPSLVRTISEMESAHVAFVSEEKSIRTQAKNAESYLYKKQLEKLPYFKKLKSAGTTLGDLQACVALTKLRPGGLLWWFREEPISPSDGGNVLKFMLEKGKLACEWDLSSVSHQLPSKHTLFPKYIYLFFREFSVEKRRFNRPIRIQATGQIRSHIEVPKFLDDLARSARETVPETASWKLYRNQSPTTQQEWLEHWPGQENPKDLERLEEYKKRCLPLGQFITIRTVDDRKKQMPGDDLYYDQSISDENSIQLIHTQDPLTQKSKLKVLRCGESFENLTTLRRFILIVPGKTWITPLTHYLQSNQIAHWLDAYCENKKGKWFIKEQTLKFLPIPKVLIDSLKKPIPLENSKWADLAYQLPYEPMKTLKRIDSIEHPVEKKVILAQLYLKACELFEHFTNDQNQIFKMVSETGQISWREICSLLPENQKTLITLHPEVRLSGSLPPHIPIMRIEKANQPIPGVRFSTEKGLALHLGSANRALIEVIWDMVKDLKHPTWSEIAQGIRIARDTDILNSTGKDILKSHSEQDQKRKEFLKFLSSIEF